MHIIHVIDRLAVGGAERMLVDLANQTVEDGHRASVCITRAGGELATELHPEIEVLELGRQRRLDLSAMRRLARFVREHEVDILHVHGRSSFSMLALMKALGLIKRPLLLHDHFGRIETDRSVPHWFSGGGKWLLDQYVGVYRELAEWARSAGVPAERIHVIGNALDLRRLAVVESAIEQETLPGQPGHLLGITVAGIRPEKGTDTLLEALARIQQDISFTLLIVGGAVDEDFMRHCRNLCQVLGVEKKVNFIGCRQDVPTLLHGVDFAVMPSRSESGPLVLIEYMAFGLPFVATRVGDVSQKVERLGMGEFVPSNDAQALADAMERLLLLSNEERACRGARGRDIVQRYFDIQTVMPEWYRLYEKMVVA